MRGFHELFRDEPPLYWGYSGGARYVVFCAENLSEWRIWLAESDLQVLGFFLLDVCTLYGRQSDAEQKEWICEAKSWANMDLLRRTSLVFEQSLHVFCVARRA
jgi:hypothetical protein